MNNLRDIPGDTVSGKRTLAVRLGDGRTRVLYVALVVLPFVLVPFVAGLGERPGRRPRPRRRAARPDGRSGGCCRAPGAPT